MSATNPWPLMTYVHKCNLAFALVNVILNYSILTNQKGFGSFHRFPSPLSSLRIPPTSQPIALLCSIASFSAKEEEDCRFVSRPSLLGIKNSLPYLQTMKSSRSDCSCGPGVVFLFFLHSTQFLMFHSIVRTSKH